MSEIIVHHDKAYDAFELQSNNVPCKLIAAVFYQDNEERRLNLAEAEIYADLFAAAPETKKQRDALLEACKELVRTCNSLAVAPDLTGLSKDRKFAQIIVKAEAAIELAKKEG